MDGPAVVASPPTDGLRRKNPTDLEDLVLELDDADLNDVDSSRDSNDFKDIKLTESPPSMEVPSEKSVVPCENTVSNSSPEESSIQSINKDSVVENGLIEETKQNLDINITELPAACESNTELPVEVKKEEVEIKEEIKEDELTLDPSDVPMDNIDSIDKELDGLLNNDSENLVENVEIKDEGDSVFFEYEPMEGIATEPVAVAKKDDVIDNPVNEGMCAPSIPLNGEALSSDEITPTTDQENSSDKTDSNQVISGQTEKTPDCPLNESLLKDDSMDSIRDDTCLDEIDDSNTGSEVLGENSSDPRPTSPEPAPLIVDKSKEKPSNKRQAEERDFEEKTKKIKTNSGEKIMNGLIETKKHINGFREDALSEKKVKELEKIIRKPNETCSVQTDDDYMIAREQLGALKGFHERPLTVDGNMLEELVMMKVVEYLTIGEQNEKKLECAALMKKCRFLENALQQTQKRTQELTKQVEDAKHIIKKLVEDRVAAKKPLLPLRVTRSVGLQVCTVGSVNVVSTKQKDLESIKKLMGEANAVTGGGAGITSSPDEDKDDIIYVGETPAAPKENETSTKKSGEKAVVSSSKSPTSTTPSLSTAKSRTPTTVPQDKNTTTPCIDLTDADDAPPPSKPTKDKQAATKSAAISVKPPSALYSPDKLNGPVTSTPKESQSNPSNSDSKKKSTPEVPSKKVSFGPPVTETVSLAELPKIPASPKYPADAVVPPRPILRIGKNTSGKTGIMLSWCFENQITPPNIEEYHLFAYQESKDNPGEEKGEHCWKKVGNIQALPLPMACFLTQFIEGHTYHFIVRAVNKDKKIGEFSLPGSISLGKDDAPSTSAPASSSTKTN